MSYRFNNKITFENLEDNYRYKEYFNWLREINFSNYTSKEYEA